MLNAKIKRLEFSNQEHVKYINILVKTMLLPIFFRITSNFLADGRIQSHLKLENRQAIVSSFMYIKRNKSILSSMTMMTSRTQRESIKK